MLINADKMKNEMEREDVPLDMLLQCVSTRMKELATCLKNIYEILEEENATKMLQQTFLNQYQSDTYMFDLDCYGLDTELVKTNLSRKLKIIYLYIKCMKNSYCRE